MKIKKYLSAIREMFINSHFCAPLCFYGFFLISRMVYIFSSPFFTDTTANLNMFIAKSLLEGVPPTPLFFQIHVPYGGIGSLLFDITSVPFILLFGKNLFALRLTSLVLVSLMFFLVYIFIQKYMGKLAALISCMFFAFMPEMISRYALVGEGRHFHLNFFIFLSLVWVVVLYQQGRWRYWLLFVASSALGMYFYPAYSICLVSFTILALVFFMQKRYFCGVMLIGGVILALYGGVLYEFFFFQGNLNRVLLRLFFFSPKIAVPDSHYVTIVLRFIVMVFYTIPALFTFQDAGMFFDVDNLHTVTAFAKGVATHYASYRFLWFDHLSFILFIGVYISAIIFTIRALFFKKTRASVFAEKKGGAIVLSFCSIYFFVYTIAFSASADKFGLVKYYLPLYFVIIVMLSFFIQTLCRRKKWLGLVCAVILLVPGGRYQFERFYDFSGKGGFYRYFVTFYEDKCTVELFSNKESDMHFRQALRFDERAAHTLGVFYSAAMDGSLTNEKDVNPIIRLVARIRSSDETRWKLISEGFFCGWSSKYPDELNSLFLFLDRYDIFPRQVCYRGAGEGCAWTLERPCHVDAGYREKIATFVTTIESRARDVPVSYRSDFFEGAGQGLARSYAKNFQEIMQSTGFFDANVLWDYLVSFETMNAKKAFFKGFQNPLIWKRL